MPTEVPTLLLSLQHPIARRIWHNDFTRSLRQHDFFSILLTGIIQLSIIKRNIHLSGMYLYTLLELGLSLWMFILQMNANLRTFAKHRTLILYTVRLFRLCLVIFFMVVPPREHLAYPLFTQTDFQWSGPAVWRLLIKTSMPVIQVCAWRVPLKHHFVLTGATVLSLLFFTDGRCAFECSGNPQFYGALYSRMISFLSPLQQVCVPITSSPAPGFELLQAGSCRQMCDATNAFLIIFCGFVVTSLVLAAVEETSKLGVLAHFGGTPFYLSTPKLLGYSLALLPFYAALTFEFVYAVVTLLPYL